MNYALIFAGGSGQRMKTNGIPKQFLKIENTEIIIHTLLAFENSPDIDGICIVCIENWIEHMEILLKKHHIQKVKRIVTGGKTGQESIYNGLIAINEFSQSSDVVLIHDGVRPFINNQLINDNIRSVLAHGSAITVTGAIETIITLNNEKCIDLIIDRASCYHAKAPQSFIIEDILNAHKKAINEGKLDFIDSASMMKYYGYKLHTVSCGSENIKITTPSDYYIAKALFIDKESKNVFGV